MAKYDFSGWATRNNLKCSDGRTIMKDAFKDNDGKTVPLVWNHQHNEPENVLGHALLQNRSEGVYAYCTFNESESGRNAKELVEHGDVTALSIYANQLKQNGGNVLHGAIREVSLVLAGANPGALIDSIIQHNDDNDEEAIIYTGEELCHAEDENDDGKELEHAKEKETDKMAEEAKKPEENDEEKTIEDVLNTFNEDQKKVLYFMVGKALEEKGEEETNEKEKGDNTMKHNAFNNDDQTKETVLSHSDIQAIFKNAKSCGSLKEALEHAEGDYGIEDIDVLFPDAKAVATEPDFIKRDTGWVAKVLNGAHHTPFSRIKSLAADITEDDARALGYIKGNLKKEEIFSMLKRTTTPITIYKKQKLDRDDMLDITDFDVVAFLKKEMRMMLDEEIARAVLVGDGRLASSDDKINEGNIRPIANDLEDDLYAVGAVVDATNDELTPADIAREFIKTVKRSFKEYKGSGNPSMFITEDLLTECLMLEDGIGRPLYDTVDKLATALRVKEIVSVPVLEYAYGGNRTLAAIIVNMRDYTIGADKGGAVSMFEDFDIDYNQQKYLIETRCSGALTKPKSAIVVAIQGPTE